VTSTELPSPANQNQAPNQVKKRQHRDWSGAAFFLLISIAGLTLGRLGHLWIAFDVFSQFSIQFMFLGVAMIMGLVFPRYKSLAGLAIFTAMIVAYGLWPQLQGRAPLISAAPDEMKPLKFMSFNAFAHNHDITRMVTEIQETNADVVSFVEFGADKMPVLEALQTLYPFQMDCNHQTLCDHAIISKLPLQDSASQNEWEWAGPTYLRASLGSDYGNVTIYAVHTSRFPHARFQFRQIQAFIAMLENNPGRVIVAGDFNATPFSRVTQTLSDSLDLTRLTNLPTWPATYSFPQLAIDHMFVSKDIVALDQERLGHYAGSDHFPISITLALPQK
jgi:endonuclease/exonuclease/phosphatase (EEP) superfamily protein YafD